MEEALEKAKKAVAECNPKSDGSYAKTVRALLTAVAACKQYIKDNATTDRGCAQRIARSLDEVLDQMPGARKLGGEKTVAHNRKLAEAHIDLIEERLKAKIGDMEEAKGQMIEDWVKKHAVFCELKRISSGHLPKGAYALLFRRGEDDNPELMSQTSQDGRVFTRFRTQEFRDDNKLYKQYKSKPAVVGAVVIAERELLLVIGNVPQPEEGREQIQHLLALSNQAASMPVREYLEKNTALKQLHDLASRHKLPKQCFILLFKAGEQSDEQTAEQIAELGDEQVVDQEPVPAGEQPVEEAVEQPAEEAVEQPAEEADEQPAEDAVEQPAEEAVEQPAEEAVEQPAEEAVEQSAEEPVEQAAEEVTEQAAAPVDEQPGEQPEGQGRPEIVEKTTAEGKTVTRFWPNEFSDKYKLFEYFRDKPEIVGAAVIQQSKLLHEIGKLPRPAKGQTQLQVLLQLSGKVMERPLMEFIDDNEVLKGLLGLATGESPPRDAYVLLFASAEGGKVEVLSLPRSGSQRQPRIPLSEFTTPRAVHERFSGLPKVVGASVIVDQSPSRKPGSAPEGKGRPGESDGRKRPGAAVASKPVVLVAFGRTPLKAGHLATAETLTRLGIRL